MSLSYVERAGVILLLNVKVCRGNRRFQKPFEVKARMVKLRILGDELCKAGQDKVGVNPALKVGVLREGDQLGDCCVVFFSHILNIT